MTRRRRIKIKKLDLTDIEGTWHVKENRYVLVSFDAVGVSIETVELDHEGRSSTTTLEVIDVYDAGDLSRARIFSLLMAAIRRAVLRITDHDTGKAGILLNRDVYTTPQDLFGGRKQ